MFASFCAAKAGADMPDWLKKLVESKGGKIEYTDEEQGNYDEDFDPDEKRAPPSL